MSSELLSEQPRLKPPIPRLEAGDHLDQKMFHQRYKAMPENFRAELIGGIVVVPSPLSLDHGQYHVHVIGWLMTYLAKTPGTRALDNTTTILAENSEPQPDASLIIDPEYSGQSGCSEDGYVEGPPELIVEVASSSESYDLHGKLRDYEKAGVLEYVVVLLRQRRIRWFVGREGKFEEMEAEKGIFRSTVFAGLWLDEAALLGLDAAKVLETLQQGLSDPGHAAFVGHLQERRKKS